MLQLEQLNSDGCGAKLISLLHKVETHQFYKARRVLLRSVENQVHQKLDGTIRAAGSNR